jgi:hypothetical protein
MGLGCYEMGLLGSSSWCESCWHPSDVSSVSFGWSWYCLGQARPLTLLLAWSRHVLPQSVVQACIHSRFVQHKDIKQQGTHSQLKQQLIPD